jgi:hypothetical protein
MRTAMYVRTSVGEGREQDTVLEDQLQARYAYAQAGPRQSRNENADCRKFATDCRRSR